MSNSSKFRCAYHFLPASHADDDIRKKRIKLSRFSDLNDPYELEATTFDDPHFDEFLVAEWKKNAGLLCFCNEWSNSVMWTHYADRHRGVVLGFDVMRREALEVRYVDQPEHVKLPDVPALRSPNMSVSRTLRTMRPYLLRKLTTKHSDWLYEHEVRMLTLLEHQDEGTGHFFVNFRTSGGLYLREVILGMRCMLQERQICNLVTGFPRGVTVRRAQQDRQTFKIVEATSTTAASLVSA